MTKKTIQNGQAEYGICHVMEEEMRAAEQGVFEEHSSEVGLKRKRAPVHADKEAPASKNKAVAKKASK